MLLLLLLAFPLAGVAEAAPSPETYVVQRGDTLAEIAVKHGTTAGHLARINGLRDARLILPGQIIRLPGTASTNPAPPAATSGAGARRIDVNLSTQRLTAYEGNRAVFSTAVSTGTRAHPTVVGRFRIWTKLRYDDMTGGSRARGDYYYLKNVPHVMYFYRGHALHGTYWHSNFGRPMSHGCVNLSRADAAWLFNWASVGTRVVTHY